MVKNMLLITTLFSVSAVHAMAPATDMVLTPTLAALYGTQQIPVATDLVTTPTQFAFVQGMNQDLQAFISSLAADRQLFQSWNMTLIQLAGSLNMYEQQHSNAINQVRATIGQLQQLVTNQERQGQDYLMTINALTEKLALLQKQTDLEIIALQQQLDETTLELDMLEDEYGDFIDASFAHAQGFYNMLQMAKEEYAALIGERTQFFNSLQVLTNALHNHAQGMNNEIFDLVQGFNAPKDQPAA